MQETVPEYPANDRDECAWGTASHESDSYGPVLSRQRLQT